VRNQQSDPWLPRGSWPRRTWQTLWTRYVKTKRERVGLPLQRRKDKIHLAPIRAEYLNITNTADTPMAITLPCSLRLQKQAFPVLPETPTRTLMRRSINTGDTEKRSCSQSRVVGCICTTTLSVGQIYYRTTRESTGTNRDFSVYPGNCNDYQLACNQYQGERNFIRTISAGLER
jgi:hypothetical protein